MRAKWATMLAGIAVLATAETAPPSLESKLARIAAEAGGVIGVAVQHLESNQSAGVRASDRFPMASVYKFPIAVTVLDAAAGGRLRLDSLVHVAASDLRTGASPIAERHPAGEIDLRVEELLAGMLVESDNTATDVLLRLVGGPAAVTAHVRRLGCSDLRVDRTEVEILFDASGVRERPPPSTWTRSRLQAVASAVPKAERQRAAAAFRADRRDSTTPSDLVLLLGVVANGGALDAANRKRLFEWMESTTTGPNRLRGELPRGTPVAHKTGTIGTVVNDAGIITLPGDRGRVAIAVFTMNVPGGTPAAERAIARLGRAAYDHWMR